MTTIETDYLVIGAGAVGMAFADTLVTESDAHITIIDRQSRPGGHWNDAYGFVALHQPSAFYGVNSLPLGTDRKDTHGVNAGLYELASGAEVSGYYDRVMRQSLLASGRVTYLPMTAWRDDGRAVSLMSGAQTAITVRRKTVDTTHNSPVIPANHTPRFAVEEGVRMVPPGVLPRLWLESERPARFVVLGAGKTAMDAIGWLLAMGTPADAIQWIKPRDSWLIDRSGTQPGEEFFDEVFGRQLAQMRAFAQGTSPEDIFARLEAAGVVLRIDPEVMPTMFHYATISHGEVAELRRVTNVVRKGRVTAITPEAIMLEQGSEPAVPGALYIDCTASAVEPRAAVPIFQGDRIVPQLVRVPQPCFSAALIAFVEAHYPDDDAAKNILCRTVPFPHDLRSYLTTNIVNIMNQGGWFGDERLGAWIRRSRLDGFGKIAAGIDRNDAARVAVLQELRATGPQAVANLMRLAAQG
ncbi:NAD(P)-binding protein [Porphyrobacter sp. YT40]|uniref:NAD(P)-binding protein n=1 Tax=Porphyrobacter sp. YT40 TaxID=2547601 RepID=UPI0015E8A1AD|nr:NAD(P)-binding protein [Porphyrobacter sp. YT40]